MVNESYSVGKELVPIYLMGTILSSISSFLGNTFSAIKKNNLLFLTMLLGSVANVVCIHILVPLIGIQASNIALAIGFLLLVISRIVLLKKSMTLKIDYASILLMSAAFVGATFVYTKGNLIANIAVLLAAAVLTLYIFREYVQIGLQKVKGKR